MTKMMIALATLVLSAGMSTAAQAAGCKEGARARFTEVDENDRAISVWRTCENGSYYPKAKTIGAGCVEGTTTQFTEVDENDRAVIVTRTCHDGRYYPKAGPVKVITCTEGARALFYENDGTTNRIHAVWKTCVNGKYVN